MNFVRSFVSSFALVALLFAGSATIAGAVTPEEMPGRDVGCDVLGQSIVKPDGAILAVGAAGCGYPNPENVLIQFTADGQIDTGFSGGGVKVFPPDANVFALMPAGQSGAVFATGTKLTKITSDGSLDQTFGQGGEIDLSEVFEFPIDAAATQQDGKIVLSGYGGSATVKFARITSDGELDDQFGGDGIVEHPLPAGLQMSDPPAAIAFDDSNRIIATNRGGDSKRPFVLRLLGDGGIDTTFGPGNDGFSVFDLGSSSYFTTGGFTAATVSGNGDIWMYGTASAGAYWYDNLAFGFDSSGTPKGDEPVVHGTGGSGVFAVTSDGNLASTKAQERAMPSYFNVTETDQAGSPVSGFSSEPLALSPSGGKVGDLTYDFAGDSLIATGYVSGDECSPTCSSRRFMAIAKVNAKTGEIDPSFGTGGATLIPGNRCAHGVAPYESPRAWSRCNLKAPHMTAKVRFNRGASRNPGITGVATLSAGQDLPGNQERTLTVKLPARLELRAGNIAKRLIGTVENEERGETTVHLRGKTLVVKYRPLFYPDAPGQAAPPGNSPVRITFGLKRGALKPLPRKLRRKALSVQVKGTFSSDPTWYASSSTSKVLRVRPVK